MIRRCTDCGDSFQAKGDWQRRCWKCWRAEKERGELRAAYDLGFEHGFEDGRAAATRRNGDGFSASLLREVIALTHPDRHPPERFELANRITSELVALRSANGESR